jgi:hypothetical protein
VLCNNILAHVSDFAGAACAAVEFVAPGGYVLATTPERFRRANDPIDNDFRPTPAELYSLLAESGGRPLLPVRHASIRIDDESEYGKAWLLPPSTVDFLGRQRRVPGLAERIRWVARPLRWRSAAVLARVEPP